MVSLRGSLSRHRPMLAYVALFTPTLGAPTLVHAAGFSLLEQTGSGIGYAYAGAAASADDASALYFNPANLSLLTSPQIAVVAHGINLKTEFSDQGSRLPLVGLGALPAGDLEDNAGDLIPVPNAYVALPLNERLAFGLGVNAPFGLVTEYADPWVGRFQGIRSELVAINVNPAASYRVNDAIALGVGLNYQQASAELTNAVILAPGVEGRAELDVDDEAFGWNVGALLTLPSATRIGLSYRSKLDFKLTGDTSVFTLARQPVAAASGPTRVDITFPDSVELSAAQPIGDKLEVRADVNWMNWSEVGTIVAINTATGVPRDVLQFGFKNTIRAALGVDYKLNEQWNLRAGAAWDETPVTNELRTVRLPDTNRKWLTLGARWQPTEKLLLDAGYAHLFVQDGAVNLTRSQVGAPSAALFASTVTGGYESSVDIASLQVTYSLR